MHTCRNIYICIDEDDSYRQYKRHESDLNHIVKEGAFGYSPSGDGVLGYVPPLCASENPGANKPTAHIPPTDTQNTTIGTTVANASSDNS